MNNYVFDCRLGQLFTHLAYVLKGNVTFISANSCIQANSGDLVFIPKRTRYTSYWKGNPEIEFYAIQYLFEVQNLSIKNLNEKKYFNDNYPLQIIKCPEGVDFAKLIKQLEEHYYNSDDLLLAVSDFYSLYNQISKNLICYTDKQPNNHIIDAIYYIETNYTKDFTISDLAKLCHISESSLYQLFKKETGYTPIEYKNRTRIRHAVELLSGSSYSIELISKILNFSTPSYFRRVFKKIMGKQPSEYRNNDRI